MLFNNETLFIFVLRKIDIDRRHHIKVLYELSPADNIVFSKCKRFPVKVEDNAFFVSGVSSPPAVEFTFCSVARSFDHICGKNGKYWVPMQEN
jgi:hypothetical protein